MSFKALPSQDQLKALFEYDVDTGILLNKRLKKRSGYILKGGNSTKAHWVSKIGKTVFTQQRLIWMWVYGEDPGELLVDHIDQDSLNNRLDNLRLVTRRQNRQNSKLNSNNTSGYRGVYKMYNKWQARIMISAGRSRSIGVFDTPEEAHKALTTHGGLSGPICRDVRD